MAAVAAVAATAAPAGVVGRSKGSWSAWLRSWSPGSSYGKAWGSAGGRAVALPACARSGPARTRAWLVPCDSRGAPGPLRARGRSALRPCLAGCSRAPCDSAPARGSEAEAQQRVVCPAPRPRRCSPAPRGRAATSRALPLPGHLVLPGLLAARRPRVRPERERVGVQPHAASSPSLLTPR